MTSSFPGTPQAPDWAEGDNPHVLWTRGSGCASLAALLGGERAHKVEGELRTACIQERADLLVTRKHSSFDLIDVAVPHHFVPERISNVVAAVAGGPHSSLAARVAGGVASSLGVPGRIVTGSPSKREDAGSPNDPRWASLQRIRSFSRSCSVLNGKGSGRELPVGDASRARCARGFLDAEAVLRPGSQTSLFRFWRCRHRSFGSLVVASRPLAR